MTRLAQSVLHLSGVRHRYPIALGLRRVEVLRGIDLELARGEGLGIVGPNGSGKSTLLRVIAGVERPFAGELEVLQGSPALARVRERIGFLPEDSPFPRELRALGALKLLGSLRRVPDLADRARRVLARVGLEDQARVPLSRFSRGMLRRFGLAQAILHEPDLLLLDEPTAGLDAPGFEVLEEVLGEAKERGASIVVSSHVHSDVHAHCEHLVVMLDGRVAARGSPEEVTSADGRRLAAEPLADLYRDLGRPASGQDHGDAR